MAEEYPCNLPLALVVSNSYSSSDTVIANDISHGPLTFFLKSIDNYLMFDCEFSYSAIEKQVFTSWYHWFLVDGAKSFTIRLKANESTGDSETTDYLCYISGVPQYTQSGARWKMTLKLIVIKEV